MCQSLESLGDRIPLRVSENGRVFLNPPLGSGNGLSATAHISSVGCKGSYASAIKELEAKLMAIYANPDRLVLFHEKVPYKTLTFRDLRDSVLSLGYP